MIFEKGGEFPAELFNALKSKELLKLTSALDEIREERLQQTEVFQDASRPLFQDMEQISQYTKELEEFDNWSAFLKEVAYQKALDEAPDFAGNF